MNCKTCTLNELVEHMNLIINETCKRLDDSPRSKAEAVSSMIGFFQGVCAVRDFYYKFEETTAKWNEMI